MWTFAVVAAVRYLGTSVLILLDLSFSSRFWTCVEGWLAMQQPSTDGLITAAPEQHRWTTMPIYNATEYEAVGLERMWKNRSPAEALLVLRKPDVTVTNAKDKFIQLGKLEELDERVRTYMIEA